MASLNLNWGPPLSAVNGWPVELEGDGQHRPGGLAVDSARPRYSGDRPDLGVLEDAGVEPGRLFGLVVEPQAQRVICSRGSNS